MDKIRKNPNLILYKYCYIYNIYTMLDADWGGMHLWSQHSGVGGRQIPVSSRPAEDYMVRSMLELIVMQVTLATGIQLYAINWWLSKWGFL